MSVCLQCSAAAPGVGDSRDTVSVDRQTLLRFLQMLLHLGLPAPLSPGVCICEPLWPQSSLADWCLSPPFRHRGLIHAYEFAVDQLTFQSPLPACRLPRHPMAVNSYDLALSFPHDSL